MQFSLESLAAVATILGTGLSILALIKSRDWLIVASLPLIGVAIVAGFYARKERLALKSANVTIEGYSIDTLTAANLKRRVNRSLTIQEAHHTARIEGEDLKIEWVYAGYCRAKRETAMEFSVESAYAVTFADLDCVGFDLACDPAMEHKIQPVLIGANGLSKKISVPFIEPLRAQQPFRVMLRCTLPRCMTLGFAYYTATLSFAQDRIRRSTVRLIFVGQKPRWVRVYECSPRKPPVLIKTLAPTRAREGDSEYLDIIGDTGGQSARVYAFWRDTT
jgi:hypothetical protein